MSDGTNFFQEKIRESEAPDDINSLSEVIEDSDIGNCWCGVDLDYIDFDEFTVDVQRFILSSIYTDIDDFVAHCFSGMFNEVVASRVEYVAVAFVRILADVSIWEDFSSDIIKRVSEIKVPVIYNAEITPYHNFTSVEYIRDVKTDEFVDRLFDNIILPLKTLSKKKEYDFIICCIVAAVSRVIVSDAYIPTKNGIKQTNEFGSSVCIRIGLAYNFIGAIFDNTENKYKVFIKRLFSLKNPVSGIPINYYDSSKTLVILRECWLDIIDSNLDVSYANEDCSNGKELYTIAKQFQFFNGRVDTLNFDLDSQIKYAPEDFYIKYNSSTCAIDMTCYNKDTTLEKWVMNRLSNKSN